MDYRWIGKEIERKGSTSKSGGNYRYILEIMIKFDIEMRKVEE